MTATEHRITFQRQDQQVDDVEVIGVEIGNEVEVRVHARRVAEVGDVFGIVEDTRAKQRSVAVEADVRRTLARCAGGYTISGKHCVDRCLGNRVARIEVSRPRSTAPVALNKSSGRERARGRSRLSRERTLALHEALTFRVFECHGDVAAIVGEVAAENAADLPFFRVGIGGVGIGRAQVDAFEVVLHADVDDTGDGVGTVGRAGTAGNDFNPLDKTLRDGVEVDVLVGRGHHRTATVDENEVTVRTETAQVDVRLTAVAGVVRRGRAGRVDLRQRVQERVERDVGVLDGFFAGDDGDRAVRLEVRADDARSGDDDCFAFVDGIGIVADDRFVHILRGGGVCRERKADCQRPSAQPELLREIHTWCTLMTSAERKLRTRYGWCR